MEITTTKDVDATMLSFLYLRSNIPNFSVNPCPAEPGYILSLQTV